MDVKLDIKNNELGRFTLEIHRINPGRKSYHMKIKLSHDVSEGYAIFSIQVEIFYCKIKDYDEMKKILSQANAKDTA